MSEGGNSLNALKATCRSLLAAASEDPLLAERALRKLNSDPKLAPLVQMPEGMKRTGRRTPAKLDPLKIFADSGEQALVTKLGELDLEELRDIMAQFGMDPRRLAMKWKELQRVREHIVATTAQRSRKGDAFRA